MDRRYTSIPLHEQIALRRQAVEEVLSSPDWTLAQTIKHLRTTMRLTLPEMAKISGVAVRTLMEIEAGRSPGTVMSIEKILGVAGLRLGVRQVAWDRLKPA